MEKIMKVIAVGNVNETEISLRNGETKTIKTIPMRLADATDELIAEASDTLCEILEHNPLPIGTNVSVQLKARVSEWKDKEGNQRFSTFINIKELRVM